MIVLFVSLLLTGLVAGLFVGTQLGQVPVQSGLDAAQFAFFKQRFELAAGSVMPPLMIVTTLSPLPVLYVLRHGDRTPLVLASVAFALWVAATVVTVIYNVPVNKMATTWNPASPPADWAELRRAWHVGQTIRTCLVVPGFACLLAAALLHRQTL